jgi:hypothetical protein
MHRHLLALVSGVVALGLCDSPVSANSCVERFPDFVVQFEADIAFQLKHIQFPLRITYVDATASPEPAPRTKQISREMYPSQPYTYPTRQVQTLRHLQKQVAEISGAKAVVRFEQPDSDVYSMEFQFEKFRGCWRLSLVRDISL